ncbi:MAG: hypothetical protein JRN37_03275 [Nitrososphaerota archaeon]|nr:hypothetical protein [Nitrososphaerota archaeon]MDG7040376.1 hypothetical protein [Nitrososphaerota archaeon]MDG7043319.1 hypothetical protein [Nitrososphaerota archaeon]MDG7046883.1 hypothetical protein [Nitrososphaerota archaeon]
MMSRTYITLMFSSEGAAPSSVIKKLESIGFSRIESISGMKNIVYEWERKATLKDTLELADRVQNALKGLHVTYTLNTVNEDETFLKSV